MSEATIEKYLIAEADTVNYVSKSTYEYTGVDGRTYQCEKENDEEDWPL